MRIRVRGSMRPILRSLNDLQNREVPIVRRQAMNRTAHWLRTRIGRQVAADANVQVGIVRNRMSVATARGRRRVAAVLANWSSIPVALLRPRETRRGVVARGKLYEGSFIAQSLRGRPASFHRVGEPRLPITEDRVRLLPEADTTAMRIVARDGERRFIELFDQLLGARLRRKGLT